MESYVNALSWIRIKSPPLMKTPQSLFINLLFCCCCCLPGGEELQHVG